MQKNKTLPKREDGFEGQQFIVLSERDRARCAAHPIAKKLYPLTFGSFPSAPGHHVRRTEGKRGHTLIYCLHGRGRLELAAGRFEICEGNAFYIPVKAGHLYESDGKHPWSTMWVRFEGELADGYCEMLGLSVDQPVLYAPSTKTVLNRYQQLYAARKAYYSDLDLIELGLRLGGVLAALKAASRPVSIRQLSVEDRLLQTIDYMEKNIHQSCSLEELAAIASLSRTHYCRQFRALTGEAPMSHFLHMKINEAVHMLLHTDMKVEEIARSLGYEDPLYFSRAFKKMQGASPLQYRQNNRPL